MLSLSITSKWRNGMSDITITPLSPAIGAEISNIDLSGPIGGNVAGQIRQALLDHGAIFFRDQNLSPDQQLAFAGRFGEPVEYPFVQGLPDHPLITPILKRTDEDRNFGGIWHSDTAYMSEPPMGTVLHAIELPDVGGDTMFANMYAAFDALSDGMKAMLEPLRAVNSAANKPVSDTRKDRIAEGGTGVAAENMQAVHPVIRSHPETGRKSLFVNVAHTVRFENMTEAESAPLLKYLFDHQIREEFTCRFRWSPGAVAFWDNRCTQHYPINDYHGHQRLLHRITLRGDVPS
jgi:taurine dioxygenase